ncbi:hypothetical protein KY349_04060 [Candidatus Woesearchaeota archaeon]|nr:hypothetical protein [Candidatus Woesearchaeota archaeon]
MRQKNRIQIKYTTGFAIGKKVDTVINSANGFLLLGTSGAGRIRELSPGMTSKEKKEYKRLLDKLPRRIKNDYLRVYVEHGWTPTYAQLSGLRILTKHKYNKFRRGDAVLDKEWSKKDRRNLIHAVCMSYKLSIQTSHRLPATPNTIRRALRKALNIAAKLKSKSIALPVFCARKTYGVTPMTSLNTILSVIKEFNNSSIEKVIICFDNKVTKALLKHL